MFFGRESELGEIASAAQGQALLVVGPRRVGKSSLLSRAFTTLRGQQRRAVYVVIRQTFTSAAELVDELITKAQLGCASPVDPAESYGRQAAAMTRFIRQYLAGAVLLFDEADVFLERDRERGGAMAEELRALVQEGTCMVVLAGYGTLYQATMSQSEVAYNLGKALVLGPLSAAAARELATAPMRRMGCDWETPELTEQALEAVGAYPHLIQETCSRLLLRLRGRRSARINQEDVAEVLGGWKAESESNTLRDMLIESVEVNLSGPAQAAIWRLASSVREFSPLDLAETLTQAGFTDLDDRQLQNITYALRISGTCQRKADRYRFAIPLLREAVADLQVDYRIGQLVERWRSLEPAARASFDFWGGNGSRRY